MSRNFSSQHNHRIRFVEIPGVFFETKEGGETSNETTQRFPGGGGPPVTISGPTSTGQVTLTKSFDPIADQALLQWIRQWDAGVHQTLTLLIEQTSSSGVPLSVPPQMYHRCAKVSFTPPSASKGSAEANTITLVVQPELLT